MFTNTTKHDKKKRCLSRKRPAATGILPTSHNGDQQPRDRAPPSMWCVRGLLRSKRSLSAGRHGTNRWWFWCVVALVTGQKGRKQQAAKTSPVTRRQCERPAAPRDKSLQGEPSAGVMTQHICVIYTVYLCHY